MRRDTVATALAAVLYCSLLLCCFSCSDNRKEDSAQQPAPPENSQTGIESDPDSVSSVASSLPPAEADAATILARKQVPILCYHQIRDWQAKDSKAAKTYIVPVNRFREQLQMLADSGYQTILPDQLLAYLTTGAALPPKPIMLTFDDTNLDQFTVAAPELEKHGFRGVFFIMTVALGRPRYMSRANVKALADAGHIIGSHTWDHQNVKKYEEKDWVTQVEKPTRQLEEITGQKIEYFAYPFGLWNTAAIPALKSRGMVAAFQLAAGQDEQDPLHTIRRIIASGYWSPNSLHQSLVNSFD